MSTFTTKAKGQCFKCGKIGRLECWHVESKGQGRDDRQDQARSQRGFQRGNNRGGPHRGRGRGRAFQTNQSSEEYTKNCSENSENSNKINWLLDSGYSDHIINNCKFFDKYVNSKKPIDVEIPDGKILKATKICNVKTYLKMYYNDNVIDINLQAVGVMPIGITSRSSHITSQFGTFSKENIFKVRLGHIHKYAGRLQVKDVYYVKNINQNLLSFSKISKSDCTIIAKQENAKIFDKNRKLLAVANKINNLYCMKSFVMKDENKIFKNVTKLTEKEKWHRVLDDVNFQYLNKLVKNKMLDGLPGKIENIEMKCANCIESKMSNEPFENNRTKTTQTLELIHTDLNGPHNTNG